MSSYTISAELVDYSSSAIVSQAPLYSISIDLVQSSVSASIAQNDLNYTLNVVDVIYTSPAVTSVGVSGGSTGLTVSNSPITTSGVMTLGGTLNVANGGTGATNASAARSNLDSQKTITYGTIPPVGGSDGDIYLQYLP